MSTASRIRASQAIIPPNGHHTSVLLKQLARENGSHGEPGRRFYICWLIAGRLGARAATIDYAHDGIDTLRVDVPNDVLLSRAYLEEQVFALSQEDPTLPPDTPVIKGLV